jgi:1,4-alpha-glucan branching enzyme
MSEPRTRKPPAPQRPQSRLGADDLHLFNEGTHYRLAGKLGAHLVSIGKRTGTQFAVWAPNAQAVSVIGDWNGWSHGTDPLSVQGNSGIWEGFVPCVGPGAA